MWTLSKTIKSSIIERHSYRQQLHVFLRNYRAALHPSTVVPSATLNFNRHMKVRIQQKEHFSGNNDSVKDRDEVKEKVTLHPSTGVPPATLIFNRPMKVRLP